MQDIVGSFLAGDFVLPLLSSLLTGILIGMEREARFKSAGLRTHTLVCFSSTLLMLAATHQGEWTVAFIPGGNIVADPTRMAHGVLTGIGFLGAGVIFRDSGSVHGLTTAASLWITAALGLLFGAGMYGLSLSGAGMTLVVLVLFRLFYSVLPARLDAALRIDCGSDFGAVDLRRMLDAEELPAGPIARRVCDEGGTILATVVSMGDAAQGDRLAALLASAPDVRAFQIVPVEDMPPHAAAWM